MPVKSTVAITNKKESAIKSNKFNAVSDKLLIDLNKKGVNNNTQLASETNTTNDFLNDSNESVLNKSPQSKTAKNTTEQQNILNKISSDKNVITQVIKEGSSEENITKNILETNQNEDEKTEETITQITENFDHLLNNDLTDSKEEEEENTKKWAVASTFAPIYYNSFSTKGSPLDLQFENSPKTGSKSVAYGVKISYKLNDKLTLQSGVSKIDVGYKIGNIFINPSRELEGRLTNVNYVNTANILNVNAENFTNNTQIETASVFPIKGELNQSFGYIEVPLELKYSLTNNTKKLGVNLVGGFSTLLLNKNKVFVSTSEFSSNLGEANNLNKINFSGNIGLDVDYKINKKIYINVAPMLKIHTKTFSSNDKNFEPYLFGIYTGLNYRF